MTLENAMNSVLTEARDFDSNFKARELAADVYSERLTASGLT
jgi:hypothetical protein